MREANLIAGKYNIETILFLILIQGRKNTNKTETTVVGKLEA